MFIQTVHYYKFCIIEILIPFRVKVAPTDLFSNTPCKLSNICEYLFSRSRSNFLILDDSRCDYARSADPVLGHCTNSGKQFSKITHSIKIFLDHHLLIWAHPTLPDDYFEKWSKPGISWLCQNHADPSKVREYPWTSDRLIVRSALLRENGHFLPANSFEIRKRHLIGEQGALTIGKDTEGAVKNPMQDPSMMGDQLKGQMTNMLPMIVIGG